MTAKLNYDINTNKLTYLLSKKLSKSDTENLMDTIKNLLTLNYDTSRFLFAVAQTFYPLNNSIAHQCELKMRLEQFKMLKVMQKHSAYLSFAGKGLLLVPGPNAVLGIGYNKIMHEYAKIMRAVHYENILKKRLALKNQQEAHIEEDDEDDDGLTAHGTNNYAPIACSSKNPALPLYEPKTIVDFLNIKRKIPNQKTHDSVLKQLNYIANLSVDARGKLLESFMIAKDIDAKECKRQKWPKELIGQKGIFAAKDIPAFTVLGYYSGICFTNVKQVQKYHRENGAGYKTYVYSLPDVKYPRISAFIHGNYLSLINAGTVYVGTAQSIAHEIYDKCRVAGVYAKSLEYPNKAYVDDPEKFDLVAYVTIRPVKKGDQLLTDYGSNYWSTRLDNFTDADLDEIYDLSNELWDKGQNKKNNFSNIYKNKK